MKKLLLMFIISLLIVYPVTHSELVEAKTTNEETTNAKVVLKGDQSQNNGITTFAAASKKPEIYSLAVDIIPTAGGFSLSANMLSGSLSRAKVEVVVTGTKSSYNRKSGKIERSGKSTYTYDFTGLNSKFGKKIHFMPAPAQTLNQKYKMKVTAYDQGIIVSTGTKTGSRIVKPKLYKKWNKGTFGSPAATVEHHYDRHHDDTYVNAKNIESYLKKANKMYSKISRLKKGTKDFKFTVKKGVPKKKLVPSFKFTDKSKNSTRKQYIIVTQSKKKEILTFGGD